MIGQLRAFERSLERRGMLSLCLVAIFHYFHFLQPQHSSWKLLEQLSMHVDRLIHSGELTGFQLKKSFLVETSQELRMLSRSISVY